LYAKKTAEMNRYILRPSPQQVGWLKRRGTYMKRTKCLSLCNPTHWFIPMCPSVPTATRDEIRRTLQRRSARGSTAACHILLDNGGRTSTRNDCKSYNGGTSREKIESASGSFAKTRGTDLWPLLPTLSTLRNRGRGDIQLLGPPNPGTPLSSALVTLLLLHRPEESGADLSRGIFDETRRDRANKIVVRV